MFFRVDVGEQITVWRADQAEVLGGCLVLWQHTPAGRELVAAFRSWKNVVLSDSEGTPAWMEWAGSTDS